jgi:hypothetical protein
MMTKRLTSENYDDRFGDGAIGTGETDEDGDEATIRGNYSWRIGPPKGPPHHLGSARGVN